MIYLILKIIKYINIQRGYSLCDLCGFLIIKSQIILCHAVWCGAVWCTITYGTTQLCHFAGNFYSLCGLVNTPRLNHLVCPYQVILFAKNVHVLLEDAVSVSQFVPLIKVDAQPKKSDLHRDIIRFVTFSFLFFFKYIIDIQSEYSKSFICPFSKKYLSFVRKDILYSINNDQVP